ncbi:MAG: methylenetetrahydrofolate reductase [Elusimicrobiales bacterium]
MRIERILKNKKTLSFELFPPTDEKRIDDVFETSKRIKDFNPDFVSITDSKKWGKTKHIALAKILREKFGFNIMIHIKCVGNTEKEIRFILEEMKRLDFKNILALKGDENDEDIKRVKKAFTSSLDLLKIIPSFFSCGVALYPASHPDTPMEKEIELIKKKIELGAKFGITQMFLDICELERFIEILEKNSIKIPVIAGIMPVTSYKIFKNIVMKASNISIPHTYRRIIEKFSSDKKKNDFFKASIEYISDMVDKVIKTKISGIHFFTLNNKKGVVEIIKKTELCRKLN